MLNIPYLGVRKLLRRKMTSGITAVQSRSAEQVKKDVVLALLMAIAHQRTAKFSIRKLEKVFGFFVERLERMGHPNLGFQKDPTTRLYTELEGILEELVHQNFLIPHVGPSGEEFTILITERTANTLRQRIPEWKRARSISEDFLARYNAVIV